MDGAFDADVGAEAEVAVNFQGVALEEGGGAFGEAFFEVGDVAVVAAVELDVGRGCEALGMEGDLVLRAEGVEVGHGRSLFGVVGDGL